MIDWNVSVMLVLYICSYINYVYHDIYSCDRVNINEYMVVLYRLLKLEEVKRSGTGGRLDPYIYKVFLSPPLAFIDSCEYSLLNLENCIFQTYYL